MTLVWLGVSSFSKLNQSKNTPGTNLTKPRVSPSPNDLRTPEDPFPWLSLYRAQKSSPAIKVLTSYSTLLACLDQRFLSCDSRSSSRKLIVHKYIFISSLVISYKDFLQICISYKTSIGQTLW